MRAAILYDRAAVGGRPDVAGVLDSVRAVGDALTAVGWKVEPVPAGGETASLLTRLAGADVVFNLAEGVDGRAEDEPRVAALLELAGLPFTGASSETLSLSRRKDRVNAILQAVGVPVPAWAVASPADIQDWRRFPAIVKPVGEDGSVGIDERSVVEDALELSAAATRLGGAALVQQFVDGRELNVGIVGGVVLPVAEIRFTAPQRVVSYAAKWDSGSAADLATRPVCPAPVPEPLRARVTALAAAAWSAVGGSGYGRVDLRLDAMGQPWVLEVNPNPDLAPDAGLARMARAAGWSYDVLVGRIVKAALP